ncbi:B-box zinc finger protein 32-like [Nymphaea colorata]|uniref:B box-type domain-containing protein n=1 Tax=Nymphaea colorata TaxID=210225 RepID=A0A5K1BGA8_9MAGN|nr:B-box zinc finger protein 32-like [Nymphaea colorata]
MARRNCELCAGEASVFCLPDSAFLCWSCDARVHDANFLVARHLRRPVCSSCQKPAGGAFSGAVVSPLWLFCNSCKGEEDEEEEEESSSAESYAAAGVREKAGCGMKRADSASMATTTEEEEEGPRVAMRRRNGRSSRRRHGMVGQMDARAEEVLERWGRRLGLRNACASVPLAMHAFEVRAQRMGAGCSVRVWLAGSLWLGVRLCERKAGQEGLLRKLESVGGVPSRIILLAESKLSRMLKLRVEEEGWAECSS